MQGKVALEEHFAIEETLQDSAVFSPEADWPELKGRLLDIQDRRLREMDAHGIEVMLLSLNAPVVQAIPDRNRAGEIARRANDFLPSKFNAGPAASADLLPCRCKVRTLRRRSSNGACANSGFVAPL